MALIRVELKKGAKANIVNMEIEAAKQGFLPFQASRLQANHLLSLDVQKRANSCVQGLPAFESVFKGIRHSPLKKGKRGHASLTCALAEPWNGLIWNDDYVPQTIDETT